MLFVVFGADCDHVGDIYECPQGTYAIGRRAPLQNNFIYTKAQTTKIFVIQTTNLLFMILYNCNFMMYCMRFHTGFLFGVGLRVYFATTILLNLHYFDAHLCSVLCTK